MEQDRVKRLRRMVKDINRQRRQMRKKMDILCNDIVSAQGDICKRMEHIAVAADFFESIIGTGELGELFERTAEYLRDQNQNLRVAFFLRGKPIQVFVPDANCQQDDDTDDIPQLEEFITEEVVEGVCKQMRLCDLDDMVKHGLAAGPMVLKGLDAAAVPIREPVAIGFVLIYAAKVEQADIRRLNYIRSGLARAVKFCHANVQ